MLSYTVGTTGAFASWKEAWDYLVSLGALTDDYEFKQIGDCTINDNWDSTPVDFNGHYVKFYCPTVDSHRGNPTQGFVTYVNGTNGHIWIVLKNNTLSDRVIIDGLMIVQTSNDPTRLVYTCPYSSNTPYTVTVSNLIIKGYASNTINTGIDFGSAKSAISVSNVKIWNCGNAFSGIFYGDNIDRSDTHIAENVTVHIASIGGNFGFRFWSSPGMPLGSRWTLRNCVAYGGDGLTSFDWHILPDSDDVKAINCAGSDGSLTDPNNTGTTKTAPQDNIVPADEFASLDDTDSDFLFLKEGAIGASFIREPLGNLLVNQDCKFTPSVVLTPGSLALGQNGIASTLETTDIAGEAKPGTDGYYSIGAHEQQYV